MTHDADCRDQAQSAECRASPGATTFSIMTLIINSFFASLSLTAHWCHYAECRILFIVILSVAASPALPGHETFLP
jgi:hypothetical protein